MMIIIKRTDFENSHLAALRIVETIKSLAIGILSSFSKPISNLARHMLDEVDCLQ